MGFFLTVLPFSHTIHAAPKPQKLIVSKQEFDRYKNTKPSTQVELTNALEWRRCMTTEVVDNDKRRFLTQAATVVGALGAGLLAVPFVSSMRPSAKAEALGAPVEVDVSKLEPGQRVVVMWRGKPVWVVRRTPEALANLSSLDGLLLDPKSEQSEQPESSRNEARAIKPEIFVAVGICTHLGCSPVYRPELAPADLGSDWKGGFFCPCHGSKFDLAGRVYKGVPAPVNLEIPPYYYASEARIVVGLEGEKA
jgi:ubiquinol-cytochrome c reductase iron-sulfur subunit